MHPRYHEWLDHLFNHPVHPQSVEEWYFDVDAPTFEVSEVDAAILIAETFERSGTDLLRFSNEQVGQGLNYLVSALMGDFMYALKSNDVPIEITSRAVRSISILYRDCFAKRCSERLCSTSEESSRINGICYMFWDVIPLTYLKDYLEEPTLAAVIMDVLRDTLALDHLGCQEGALHGLGEYHGFYPEPVERIIRAFIESGIKNPELKDYALRAKVGDIL